MTGAYWTGPGRPLPESYTADDVSVMNGREPKVGDRLWIDDFDRFGTVIEVHPPDADFDYDLGRFVGEEPSVDVMIDGPDGWQERVAWSQAWPPTCLGIQKRRKWWF